ncbi:thermonuclease family protein [Microbacterium sulfonylureivorans]|uniref:thermonuclease family protein n=1 Tax=Microbacterium sulfonylureivorans TaxID=2486854 RepID=UPI000FDC020E|nr:thermonuclease family protein [Microbacterium sulfonylureivorans]
MKRVVTAVVILLAAALVAGVIWLSSSTGRIGDAAPTTAPTPALGIPPRPTDAFPLTVEYVFDGDTIEARMLQPNDVVTTSNPIRIRLIGIDTPEGTPTPECWAEEARAHLSTLLPPGSTVWAAPDRETWDDYGRRLFNLWTDDGRFVNHELVAAGDAEAMAVRPNVAFSDLLSEAQAGAEASGAGRWSACD